MLTSAELKVDLVCDVAMTSTPTCNVLTTELRELLYNQSIDNMCCYLFFYLSHGMCPLSIKFAGLKPSLKISLFAVLLPINFRMGR